MSDKKQYLTIFEFCKQQGVAKKHTTAGVFASYRCRLEDCTCKSSTCRIKRASRGVITGET
jgi:hypothetical protein